MTRAGVLLILAFLAAFPSGCGGARSPGLAQAPIALAQPVTPESAPQEGLKENQASHAGSIPAGSVSQLQQGMASERATAAVMPVAAASTPGEETSRQKAGEIKRKLDMGRGAYVLLGPPREMNVGGSAIVRLWLQPGVSEDALMVKVREQLSREHREHFDPALFILGNIDRLSCDVEAMISVAQEDFKVSALHARERQAVLDDAVAEWSWDLRLKQPQENAPVVVNASIYASANLAVTRKLGDYAVKGHDTIATFYERHKAEIQWIIGGGSGGTMLMALGRWIRRRTNGSDNA